MRWAGDACFEKLEFCDGEWYGVRGIIGEEKFVCVGVSEYGTSGCGSDMLSGESVSLYFRLFGHGLVRCYANLKTLDSFHGCPCWLTALVCVG